ncbi:hypothetical protein J7E87_19735 [Streptomyces sp. ISL-1]|uniref:hypothetical protein n=1 Tax=Streptomyces sp. ISL-1 TaxID=2817657 RepID=UPI001BE9598F|nr:hypothetical protein [Streptomyces sp. ISL-1]MBT2391604.1 hypothetical protein [Streptomyces sp. ISL-1]
MLRHGSAVGADLPPDEAVTVDAVADPTLRAALAAAASGDAGPARELLAQTRLDAQWERRSGCVSELAECALHSPGWLEGWLAASPEDPDAMLVKADLCIQQAWEIRTGHRASHVSEDQFRAFFTLLEDAVPVIAAAAELNPTDPVPWEVALTHARGIQAPREVFDTYWAQAVARAPHHYGCHATALQYLCDKWYGSHEEMFAFAERAAEGALPGSKLHALPLMAAVEYEVVSDDSTEDGPIGRARVEAAVTRALELSSWYEPGDPDAAGFRNHLALMLIFAERWTEALEVFRAIGVHARSFPWGYVGEARKEFLEFRLGVRMQVASQTPFFGRPQPTTPTAAASVPAPRSLAIAAAPPHEVAEAALMCGVSLRIAPAPSRMSYVELVPDPSPGRRATLAAGEELLTAVADNFTTGEKWPALVLRRTDDRYGFTLFLKGKPVASHLWDPSAPVTGHTEATATAQALAAVFPVPDPRPLLTLLRGTNDPARRQSELVTALKLPLVPAGFGERDEILADFPGAQLLARRGVFKGIRDTMSTDLGTPAIPVPRPRRWWVLRIAALTVMVPTAVYGWWSPDVGWYRTVVPTAASLFYTLQLRKAWAQRR